jgi:hypothetical protein
VHAARIISFRILPMKDPPAEWYCCEYDGNEIKRLEPQRTQRYTKKSS